MFDRTRERLFLAAGVDRAADPLDGIAAAYAQSATAAAGELLTAQVCSWDELEAPEPLPAYIGTSEEKSEVFETSQERSPRDALIETVHTFIDQSPTHGLCDPEDNELYSYLAESAATILGDTSWETDFEDPARYGAVRKAAVSGRIDTCAVEFTATYLTAQGEEVATALRAAGEQLPSMTLNISLQRLEKASQAAEPDTVSAFSISADVPPQGPIEWVLSAKPRHERYGADMQRLLDLLGFGDDESKRNACEHADITFDAEHEPAVIARVNAFVQRII